MLLGSAIPTTAEGVDQAGATVRFGTGRVPDAVAGRKFNLPGGAASLPRDFGDPLARLPNPVHRPPQDDVRCIFAPASLAKRKEWAVAPRSAQGGAEPIAPPLAGLAGRHLVVGLSSVYGPGDLCFFDLFQWAERECFLRLATPRKRFQLALVTDVARALWRVVDDESLTGILNVGNPAIHTDDDLAAALGEASGRAPLRSVFLSPGATRLVGRLYDTTEAVTGYPQLMSSGKAREMSFPDWLQDFSRQKSRLPGLTWNSLISGTALTRQWYFQNGWLK